MSILGALAQAYERLPDAPPFGYSLEKISFLVSLNPDGTPASAPIDLRDSSNKKPLPALMLVPQPTKRTVGIAPNFLWDKTSYALGVTAGEGRRVVDEHAAFVKRHREILAGTEDKGLQAFLDFLNWWSPSKFAELDWPEAMKDQNIIFALEPDRLHRTFLHSRPAAQGLWAQQSGSTASKKAVCLVSGNKAPTARLHPAIKGVWGAQSSGASIVSFNLDAFTSYGHEQGDNAPVSEAAAFAYTTVLNRFLDKDNGHRIQLGDASTVFWADAADAEAAAEAESVFAGMLGDVDEKMQTAKVGTVLAAIREGKQLQDVAPALAHGVRFYVLGLAPNAARLSIRFWVDNDFGIIARNYCRFAQDMQLDPPPRDAYPPLWKYLLETATLGKRENVPPNLAGEWARAILTGGRYPWTLLTAVLMRLRADKSINPLRVQILKSLMIRNFNMEVPVAIDLSFTEKGYLLGRLFAVYEQVQQAALGRDVNATIKDKFYGSASAQPRKVFSLLDRGSANHFSKLGKRSPGYRVDLEKRIGEIMGMLSPGDDPFPASLAAEQQALFALGYHHQRSEFFKSRKPETAKEEEMVQ